MFREASFCASPRACWRNVPGILASIGPWRIHLHRAIPPQGVDFLKRHAIRARAKDFLDDDTGHMNNMALGPTHLDYGGNV